MGFGGEKMFLDYYSHFWSRKWEQEEKKMLKALKLVKNRVGMPFDHWTHEI